MKNISVMTFTATAVALLTAMSVYAKNAEPPAPQPQLFAGLVESADAYSGTVSIRGPKPPSPSSGAPSGSAGIQKTPMLITRTFAVDKTATISVAGKPKATLADVKNGDQAQISFIVTPNGQYLVKSITDSGRPVPPKKPNPPAH